METGGGSAGPQGRCPACDTSVPEGATRCPECELSFVEEPEERPAPPPPAGKRRYSTRIPGIMMLVAAVVWFIAGLGIGRIYLYPPILALIGLGMMLKTEEPRRRRGGRRVR